MIKYKAYLNDIERKEIVRETSKFVVLPGWDGERKEAKIDGRSGSGYFDTWQQAQNFLIVLAQRDLKALYQNIQYAKNRLESAEKLFPF